MPSGTFAFKGSNCVETVSSLTQTGNCLALVHILACPGAVVRYEPPPARVRLGRTHLAGVTPGPSHCGAAQGLGAHDAGELALTHLVVHRGEAGPGAVVSFTLSPGEAVGAHASVGGHASSTVETSVLANRLTTVVSHIALLALAVVLRTRSPIHTPNIAVLD